MYVSAVRRSRTSCPTASSRNPNRSGYPSRRQASAWLVKRNDLPQPPRATPLRPATIVTLDARQSSRVDHRSDRNSPRGASSPPTAALAVTSLLGPRHAATSSAEMINVVDLHVATPIACPAAVAAVTDRLLAVSLVLIRMTGEENRDAVPSASHETRRCSRVCIPRCAGSPAVVGAYNDDPDDLVQEALAQVLRARRSERGTRSGRLFAHCDCDARVESPSTGGTRAEAILNRPPSSPPVPVCDTNLDRLIGYAHPGRGFVPLGTDPATVATTPFDTASGRTETSTTTR